MDLLPLVSTFLLILVAELGDKTQLAVISLACNYRAKHVFFGAMLAFLAVDGVSAAIGGPLLALLPISLVQVVSGIVFIVFGVIPLIPRKETEPRLRTLSRLSVLACFSLVALMELGDKTQLITVTLAAENSPILVVTGLTLAFTVLTGVAVLVGSKFVSKLPMKWIKIGTSILFIVLGLISLVSGVFGISLL
jgi:putative Ca2+/H+ antiporter (TMEM165/GDT1 family)